MHKSPFNPTPIVSSMAATNVNSPFAKTYTPIDLKKVNELILENIYEFLDALHLDGEYRGVEYVAINPTRPDGSLGSFSLNTKNGRWKDFATGDGGDPLDYYLYVKQDSNLTVYDAARELQAFIDQLNSQPGAAERKAHAAAKRERTTVQDQVWTQVKPVPSDAPSPPTWHYTLGKPSYVWPYRDAEGRLLGYVCRFDVDGSKQMRPLTYRQNVSGVMQWHWKGFDVPRPLYGLDRLAANPDAPVIFVEGEKTADATQILFPDYVAVAAMNGTQSAQMTDFSPLAGRKQVFIWPDNDAAGIAYAHKVKELIHG